MNWRDKRNEVVKFASLPVTTLFFCHFIHSGTSTL